MSQYEDNGLLKGVLIGSVIGGAAGLLLAPKAGRELRNELTHGYSSLSGKAHHLANSLSHTFEANNHEPQPHRSLLTGAALGAVICTIAALLLAPKSGKKLREELGDKYEEIQERAQGFMNNIHEHGQEAIEHVEEWKDILGTLVDKLSQSKKKNHGSHLDTILDWATIGVQLLQHAKARR